MGSLVSPNRRNEVFPLWVGLIADASVPFGAHHFARL
jgi:hypothetical protein